MRNLAGVVPSLADDAVIEELTAANVPTVAVKRHDGEVKTCVVGKLGAFTFERDWRYWRVKGPMPAEVAERLNQTYRQSVRVRGHCQGANVADYATWRTSDGEEIELDTDGQARVGWEKFVARYPNSFRAPVVFAAEPWAVPGAQAFIESYHVDSQEGLNALAAAIRGLSS